MYVYASKVLVDVTFTIAISDYLLMQLDQSVNCIDKTTLSNLEALSLTQSLNKRQKNQTMVRELSMVQVAHVGPLQVMPSEGVQSLKIGHF